MSNTEVVKTMYQLFAENKTDSIKEIFSKDLKWTMMKGFPGGGTFYGIEAVYEHVFVAIKQTWEVWEAISDRYIEYNGGVLVAGHYKGKHKITGKQVTAPFLSEYKIVNEKIVEYTQYTDTFLIYSSTI